MCPRDPERGQQRSAVGRVALDGPGALDRAALPVSPTVVADQPIVVSQGGLGGKGRNSSATRPV
jgi:hypothetical protein